MNRRPREPRPQAGTEIAAIELRVRGTVQGVGFRPFVYRLAAAHRIKGWVLNSARGVNIHAEAGPTSLLAFIDDLRASPPPAAEIASVETAAAPYERCRGFEIRPSPTTENPTTRISADLAVCPACLDELVDAKDRRYGYPYINCTDCGPRYSIVLELPYDRAATTMKDWPMCDPCLAEYSDPGNRRFHAQPLACPDCGPHYKWLRPGSPAVEGDERALRKAVGELIRGRIVALKGLGGYHLACDAENADAVVRLRNRKFRKEKPFAIMARDLETASEIAHLSSRNEAELRSRAGPIVLCPSRAGWPGVSPDNNDLGIMLPYTPLHHLLFLYGAPRVLVMTSANRSNEPIAYIDEEALERLVQIGDSFLIGERPIARRVEDSVVRTTPNGRRILRRSRGLAPGVVARLPAGPPILAVGADLKNSVVLVVDGEAIVSQHIGDLEDHDCRLAFLEAIADLTAMYRVALADVLIAHDAHPEYVSTQHALSLPCKHTVAVQHHRAHVASVLAEREQLDRRVIGLAFDGTGYGDDGTIWGSEFFVGSVTEGFERVGHLREAPLPGGDSAARHPAQAAAGFLSQVPDLPDLTVAPASLPQRYLDALDLIKSDLRTFQTTSCGRLFDTVAALLGFTRPITFEGQAAVWLEHIAQRAAVAREYPLPFEDGELDYRPLLSAVATARLAGESPDVIARSFHQSLAMGVAQATRSLCSLHHLDTVVLAGGVFQNEVLVKALTTHLRSSGLEVWRNQRVPANDGGISLGQAALASCGSP